MTSDGGHGIALALPPAADVGCDPLRDSRHRGAAAARELEDWKAALELAKKAPRTIDSYERTAAALLRDWPTVAFHEFTDSHINHTLRKFPELSRHINRAALNSWFKWGRLTRRIPENPMDLVPAIRYTPSRHYEVFTSAEIEAMCGLPTPDGQLCELFLWTGLRRQEARYLTGKRLDFENEQVVVLEGAKGSKDRCVPMLPRVKQAASDLVILEGIGRDDHVWASYPGGTQRARRGKPCHHNTFANWWRRCLEDADVRYRNPHMARHTFATKMREAGLPMESVQVLLGHASVKTTSDIYVHTGLDAIAAQMRELVK